MTDALQPQIAEQTDLVDIQERNTRNVQIDGVGVGIASAANPFLPVFLTRLGATAVQVGLLTSMPGVTGLFLALWIGRFLQKQRNIVPWYSLSRLLVIFAFTLTGLAPFLVSDRILIYVVLVIWAAATLPQTMNGVCFTVVMNAVAGPEGRYDLMSRRWSILGITTAIAVALAGLVLDRVGFHLNYQIIFLVLSTGGLISYYFSSRIKLVDTEPVHQANRGSFKSNLREYYHLIRQEPTFVSIALKQFVYMFGVTLGMPLFPLYFVRRINASDAWIGLLYTAQTAVLVIGYFFWARQSRRRGFPLVLLISTLCLALYPGLVALTTDQKIIFIFATIAGLFQAGIDLVFFDELMKTIPPKYSPTYVSLAQTSQYFSSIFAPLIGTYISVHIGLSNALLVSSGIRLVGFLLFITGSFKQSIKLSSPG